MVWFAFGRLTGISGSLILYAPLLGCVDMPQVLGREREISGSWVPPIHLDLPEILQPLTPLKQITPCVEYSSNCESKQCNYIEGRWSRCYGLSEYAASFLKAKRNLGTGLEPWHPGSLEASKFEI